MFFRAKFYGIIGIVSLCLVIAGCFVYNKNNTTLATQPKERKIETILFSNNQYLNSERNYYNALLVIQNKYPKEINSFQIVFDNENEDIIKKYRIIKFPTLLILDNEKVLVRIEGNHPEDHILEKIEHVYK